MPTTLLDWAIAEILKFETSKAKPHASASADESLRGRLPVIIPSPSHDVPLAATDASNMLAT